MSNTVFILGAGASKAAGVPLMDEFLDTAHNILKSKKAGEYTDSYKKVIDGISELQRVHSKSELDIQNVESVFAAFEMGRTLKKFGDYKIEQIEELITAMKQVIVHTIETTLRLPVSGGRRPAAPIPYNDFTDLLIYLGSEAAPPSSVSIITFNYDMAIDYSLHTINIPVNYSLGERGRSECLSVLKLHGSLNWARCSVCNKVVPWILSDYLSHHNWLIFPGDNITNAFLNIGSHLNQFKHCDKEVDKEPVIVPPTWNKTQHHETLSSVWSQAAEELSDAENIFVIGYSLPPTDTFFRYLYALGSVGKTPLKRFWVFNPDGTDKVEKRFRELLGPAARTRFKYFPKTFRKSIPTIKAEYPARM